MILTYRVVWRAEKQSLYRDAILLRLDQGFLVFRDCVHAERVNIAESYSD